MTYVVCARVSTIDANQKSTRIELSTLLQSEKWSETQPDMRKEKKKNATRFVDLEPGIVIGRKVIGPTLIVASIHAW